ACRFNVAPFRKAPCRDDVRRPLTPSGTNLLGLIKHLTITEAWYFGEVFGRPFPERLPWRGHDTDARTDHAQLTALFEHKLQLADMFATEHESRGEIRETRSSGRTTTRTSNAQPKWPTPRKPERLTQTFRSALAPRRRMAICYSGVNRRIPSR